MAEEPRRSIHFVGLAGAGMSALAQFHAQGGDVVTGSDRFFDQGLAEDIRQRLVKAGVRPVPQDGSGITADLGRVVVSTAVDPRNVEIARATELGVPIQHRSDCLREIVDAHEAVVVAGTSGKSTVAAMIWEILSSALGRVSVVTGGPIVRLRSEGLVGNALNAQSEALVVEGDESDGTLTKYESPRLSVLLNLGKDHKPLHELEEIFGTFLRRSSSICIFADAANLAGFRDASFYGEPQPEIHTFGLESGELRATRVERAARSSRFEIAGAPFELPVPGKHNVINALAAVCAAHAYGVPIAAAAEALRGFLGVHRRYQVAGVCDDISVVDDFAHNPDKIRAALATAQLGSGRVLAIYQPHGFQPTKFLKAELIEAFQAALRPDDRLWLPDIYTADGTIDPSITSADVVEPLAAAGVHARHVPGWDRILLEVASTAQPGDTVLTMGARDPELPTRSAQLLAAIRRARGTREDGGPTPTRT